MHGRIGGKTVLRLERRSAKDISPYGEALLQKADKGMELLGWLDLLGNENAYQKHKASIKAATHIFIADYRPLGDFAKASMQELSARINGDQYQVVYLDNPMGMNEQWEIFLARTEGMEA